MVMTLWPFHWQAIQLRINNYWAALVITQTFSGITIENKVFANCVCNVYVIRSHPLIHEMIVLLHHQ